MAVKAANVMAVCVPAGWGAAWRSWNRAARSGAARSVEAVKAWSVRAWRGNASFGMTVVDGLSELFSGEARRGQAV